MRQVRYVRTDPFGDEPWQGQLVAFVYDAPSFSVCGISAPLGVFNSLLREGAVGGGMSPGATWDPFSIEEAEYQELLVSIQETDPRSLEGRARFISIKIEVDCAFDDLDDFYEWAHKVGEKHRSAFHEKVREAERKFGIGV